MIAFGDLKNSIQKLKKYMTKMNIFQELTISKNAIQEKELKNKPAQFYLQIMHYVFTQYNDQFYKQLLELVPNLKTLSDQKFTEYVLNMSRKMLNMDPQITAEQLLSNKFVQKKIQFVADLCMNVFQWNGTISKKSSGKESKTNEAKMYMNQPINVKQTSYKFNNYEQDDDDEELLERQITVQPTEIDVEHINSSFGRGNNYQKKKTQKLSKPDVIYNKIDNQVTISRNKPNVFPKNIKNDFLEDQLQDENQFIRPSKVDEKLAPKANNSMGKYISQPQQQPNESVQYITKQQFNEVLVMISGMNNTINDLVSKFNSFHTNVVNWMNNTSAKVSILESNISTIKANL